ncbi:class I SAM-dependent methyltransferase [Longimicrobium sp.]|uniref:class I SAM-dependent methyltransferase n=1 Tax=Longimicrobium sp. TaxID=2029185 RepID=UPI002E2FE802|nr:class I SAM-dependent methyltransferase [Longimicrobium sp.]HEX6037343.1 class I SAM-dependent methyltransferase [Longimicrobium sp.]
MTDAANPPTSTALREAFGDIDIYLFDQLLRGRFDGVRTVLDAGCGAGRNLVYLLRAGYQVHAVDRDAHSVERVRELAARLAPDTPADVRVAEVDTLPFADGSMDAVISSAVLHFAADAAHFDRMVHEMWRVLRPGGLLFARLASSIGMEARVRPVGGGRYALPDGSTRFLVDQAGLLARTEALGGALLDLVKTTIVQDLRAMTTWCVRKTDG